MELTSELKLVMIDCLFIAAQNNMLRDAEAIISALPLLIIDDDDRALCESLCHIITGDKERAKKSGENLSPECCEKLACFSNLISKVI